MTNPTGGAPPPPGGAPPPTTPAVPTTGAPVGTANYAEWWKRAVGAIIDAILLGIVNSILGAIFGLNADNAVNTTTGALDPAAFTALITGNILLMILGVAYYVVLNGSEKGQTVGKMVMKIRVRDMATGGPAGYGKAFIRYIVSLVLFLLCVIPGIVDVLFPLWDDKKQTLHDKAAGTIVEDVG